MLAPFALPIRAAQHRIRVHHIDADAERRAFERHAAGEMDFGRLGRAIAEAPAEAETPFLRAMKIIEPPSFCVFISR